MKEPFAKAKTPDDVVLDQALRPKTWKEFVGQERVKQHLSILIEAAKKRQEPCDHILLYGPPGLGKTTLAHIIAKEMRSGLKVTSGPAIERAGDLAALLTNLESGDILFIDEAHRLNKTIEEVLYPALESRVIHIIIGQGPSARTLELKLPPFTLIAATTRIGLLSGPLRARFGATFRLDFYENSDIEKIIARSAEILNIGIKNDAISILASASRRTPRIANRLVKRSRDVADISQQSVIDSAIAKKTLSLLDIDHVGLEATDREILRTIIEKFNGGPVGIRALAAATAEEEDTIEDVYEPYLLRLGFLERTAQGRKATALAYQHLKLKAPQGRLI